MRKTVSYGLAAAAAIAVAATIALAGASNASPQPVAVTAQRVEGTPVPDSQVTCPGGHVTGSFTADAEGPRDPRSPEQIVADIAKFQIPDAAQLTPKTPYRAFAADGREVTRQVTLHRPGGSTAALFTLHDVSGALVVDSLHACG